MIPGGPDVAAMGGGHGLAATLAAVRRYAGEVTAVVSVADDGGSSGRLREMTGIPAPGDLRRCLVALADPDSIWARAFEYRFGDGELGGHAFGNLVIAVLAQAGGDFATALEFAAALLHIEGRVLPATSVPTDVVAMIDGREVSGQVKVAHDGGVIERLSLSPPDPPAPAAAVEAIARADQVVLGPGSLYTSVLATAVVPELSAALGSRRGGRVFVANLRTDEPEASGFLAGDQLRVLLDHGIAVDVMVYDPRTGAAEDLGSPFGVRCIAASVAADEGDRHDPVRLASVLADLA